MPSGKMPTYSYRPPVPGANPFMKTRYNRRSRLWEGGTYFRAIEPGMAGNNYSIALVEYGVRESETHSGGLNDNHDYEDAEGYLVVTNHNTRNEEIVEGPVDVVFVEQKIPWNKKIVISNLTGQPRATIYSISLQIAPSDEPPPPPVDLGPVDIYGLIHIPPYVSAKVIPRTSELTSGSTITFKARTSVYELKAVQKEETTESGGESGGTTTVTKNGWDPADLRTKVTERPDPWIEMLERSGDGEPGSGNNPTDSESENNTGDTGHTDDDKPDVNDKGVDDVFLTAFDDTFMENGDGLPPSPSIERTGPTRSIVHINKGELKNGKMGDVNKVYEWEGESVSSGAWKVY